MPLKMALVLLLPGLFTNRTFNEINERKSEINVKAKEKARYRLRIEVQLFEAILTRWV